MSAPDWCQSDCQFGESAFGYTLPVMPPPAASTPQLTRAIGLPQATAIVVGTIIGTSIFVQPSEITREVPTITGILVAWSLAGLLTFIGALVCAELASAFPHTGGVYVFLREAFSTRVAFMWGWANFWSIHSGIIAAISMVCARYIAFFVELSPAPAAARRRRRHRVISAINYVGVRAGTTVQTAITGAKLVADRRAAGRRRRAVGRRRAATPGRSASPICRPCRSTGCCSASAPACSPSAAGTWSPTRPAKPPIRCARCRARSPSASLVVTVCYIGLNAVYLYVLPLEAVRQSPRIAADVAQVLVGRRRRVGRVGAGRASRPSARSPASSWPDRGCICRWPRTA